MEKEPITVNGLNKLKSELEDLALKYTEPDIYNSILFKMKESSDEQAKYIKKISGILEEVLKKEKIKYDIKGRPKSIFSIRRKMQRQGVSFDEVYDKFAVRIIYKSSLRNEKFIAWKI